MLIEAMACGVPVVGSDSGAIPAVIGDAGLVFPEGDAAALRWHLATLMGDSSLGRDLASRGRERVLERFAQERIAEDTVALYRELCAVPDAGAARRLASSRDGRQDHG